MTTERRENRRNAVPEVVVVVVRGVSFANFIDQNFPGQGKDGLYYGGRGKLMYSVKFLW